MTDAWRPLEGIRVADFFWLIAGPAASRILADFGAEVIKVESEYRQDEIRESGVWPPGRTDDSFNAVFPDCNTNKLSMTLNLNTPRGIELAKELVRRSDIVTSNFSGDRMDRWGLGYEDLRRVKADIIVLNMPVMGTTGPYRAYGANGNGVVAYGGIGMGMGFPGRPPVGTGPLFSDFATPYFAVTAVLAAVHHRDRTGEGQFIDLAQLQATVSLTGTDVLEYTANGRVPERPGNRSRDYCPHGAYPCWGADRWCAIAVSSGAEWQSLCAAMGRPELAADPRFATFAARKSNEDVLDAEIGAWTRERDAWQVMHQLQGAGVMAGVVEDLEDMLVGDPRLSTAHFERLKDEAGIEYTVHRQPFRVDGQSAPLRRPPTMGQHNEYVFKELLGLSDEEYVALLVEGVAR